MLRIDRKKRDLCRNCVDICHIIRMSPLFD